MSEYKLTMRYGIYWDLFNEITSRPRENDDGELHTKPFEVPPNFHHALSRMRRDVEFAIGTRRDEDGFECKVLLITHPLDQFSKSEALKRIKPRLDNARNIAGSSSLRIYTEGYTDSENKWHPPWFAITGGEELITTYERKHDR